MYYKLIDEKNKEITTPGDILKYEESFYKELYSNKTATGKKQEEAEKLFKDDSLPKISEEDKLSCEGDITLKEIGEALSQLKNGKSPGSDGFTIDFYNFFWPKI